MSYEKELEKFNSIPFSFCIGEVRNEVRSHEEDRTSNGYFHVDLKEFSAILHYGRNSIEIVDRHKTTKRMVTDDGISFFENSEYLSKERVLEVNGFDYKESLSSSKGVAISEITRDLELFADKIKSFAESNKIFLGDRFQYDESSVDESLIEVERSTKRINGLSEDKGKNVRMLNFLSPISNNDLAKIKRLVTVVAADYKRDMDFYGKIEPAIADKLDKSKIEILEILKLFSKKADVERELNGAIEDIKDSSGKGKSNCDLQSAFKLIKRRFEKVLNLVKDSVIYDREIKVNISIYEKEIERLEAIVTESKESSRKKQEFIDKLNKRRTVHLYSLPGTLLPMIFERMHEKHSLSIAKMTEINDALNNAKDQKEMLDYLSSKTKNDFDSALFFALNKSPDEISALISSDSRKNIELTPEFNV